MSSASNRGLSARTIALGSVAVLAGLAAINRQRALDAQRRYPPGGDFIRVRGVRLHKIDTGGPGPAVILLHGNGVTLADMEISGLVARAARRRRVVAFDRPGFGYSERPRGIAWTPAAQAESARRRTGANGNRAGRCRRSLVGKHGCACARARSSPVGEGVGLGVGLLFPDAAHGCSFLRASRHSCDRRRSPLHDRAAHRSTDQEQRDPEGVRTATRSSAFFRGVSDGSVAAAGSNSRLVGRVGTHGAVRRRQRPQVYGPFDPRHHHGRHCGQDFRSPPAVRAIARNDPP